MGLLKNLMFSTIIAVVGLVTNSIFLFLSFVYILPSFIWLQMKVFGTFYSYTSVIIFVFVLGLACLLYEFLKKKYSTPLYGVIWITTSFTSLYIVYVFSVSHGDGLSLPHWVGIFAVCLIIVHAAIFYKVPRQTSKAVLISLLILTPPLSVYLPQLFPDSMVIQQRPTNQNSSIKNVLNNFRTQAELYYNTNDFSYEGVCNYGDTYNLIDHVKTSYTDNVVCIDEVFGYAIEVKLLPYNGKEQEYWWCVDSTGYHGQNPKQIISVEKSECGS